MKVLKSESKTPLAIVIGSILISISILLSGGIIKIKGLDNKTAANTNPQVTAQATQVPAQPTIALTQVKEAFSKSFLKFGDVNRKLIALEIADPSCPYCQIAAGKNSELNKQAGSRFTLVADGGTYVAPVPELEKLMRKGQVAFAYIYYPGHGNGEMGTKAMYCAFEQDKFWEVHDLLMTSKGYDLLNNVVKNDKTKSGDLASFLQPVFDPAVMKQCLDSGKYDNRIKDDMALATSLNIGGTPGFFLNSNPFSGAYSYKDMESVVNAVLK